MAERLPEARFTFSLEGAEAPALVVRARVAEALSAPYECVVELAWEADALPEAAELLGRRASLTIARGDHVRRVHGVVVVAEHRGAFADRHRVDLTLAPGLSLLGWRRGYRVFQGVDALAIARSVLRDAGLDDLDDARAGAPLTAREYCVQYDETDLDFVARLLSEEGLHYAFAQGEERETLVVFDGEQAATLDAVETFGELPVGVIGHGLATADREGVARFAWRRAVGVDAWRGLDYDFTHPHARVEGKSGAATPSGGVTEYPARFLPAGWDAGAEVYRPAANPRRAAGRRLERDRAGDVALSGEGDVIGFRPGALAEIVGVDGAPRRVLITRVVHLASAPEAVHAGASPEDGEDRYVNHFEAAPAEAVQRPARRPRPRASAPHVAVVTREAGSDEEIVTDRHGRVLVRFYWDDPSERTGAQAGTRTSCWLRVAQPWAGPGWGFHFTPRVGMEVVVHFLDGDPDRPFVAGCLPNAVNVPPVEVPQHRTQSALRTQSSPGGGGFNELRFEDLRDAEEVYLRAQRNQRVEVLHDRALSVRRDAQTEVGRDESLAVGRDRSVDVMGNEQHSVEGARQVSVGGDSTHEVTGAASLFVHKGASLSVDEKAKATINDGLAVFVGGRVGTSVEVTPEAFELSAPKRFAAAVGDEAGQELTTERFGLKAPKAIALVCGDTRVELGEDRIVLQTKGGARVELQGDKITVKTDGPVSIKGSSVSNN